MKKFLIIPFYISNWWLFYLRYLGIVRRGNQVCRLRNGMVLYTSAQKEDTLIINEIWGNNEYTPPTFEIKENEIVVDIGAHKGYFSVFASLKAKNGKVYAFEPLKDNYDILKKNLKVNQCTNAASFQLGISGTKGIKKLYIKPDSSAGISLIKDWFKDDKRKINSFCIQCVTLDNIFSLCHIKKIDFLKIDCEGAEYEILLNTPKETFAKIDKISMEFHQIGGLKVNILKNLLKQNGFIVKLINPENTIGMLYARREYS